MGPSVRLLNKNSQRGRGDDFSLHQSHQIQHNNMSLLETGSPPSIRAHRKRQTVFRILCINFG